MAPERDEPPYASAPEYQSILFFLPFIFLKLYFHLEVIILIKDLIFEILLWNIHEKICTNFYE